jgi:hypothetical protein
MSLAVRPLRPEELETCLAVNPAARGDGTIGKSRAIAAWRALIGCRACLSCVIEARPPIAGQQIVGFGALAFVTPQFADSEVADPRPGLNARVIASIDAHRPVVLTDAAVRCANTAGGLHIAALYTTWRRGILNAEQTAEISTHIAQAGLDALSGYRLARVITELTDDMDLQYAESWRVFRIMRFAAGSASAGLGVSEAPLAMQVPGSVAAILFTHREPELHLRDSAQQLLLAALQGMTDPDLARALKLKIPTVKKRWSAVFDHVAAAKPEILAGSAADDDRKTRGRQKRHHLLAYLRVHPEELRPVLPPSARAVSGAPAGNGRFRRDGA